LKAIEAGKRIALANKETLVIAGEYIALLMKGSRAQLIPVDSEHSAIFQCLMGEYGNEVEKVYLTASGGPFFGMSAKELERVSISEALNHPSWKMGSKISIDSATLINKGFEMIGAKWLFGLESHQMEVIVHPQSVIHSMVQFRDGTIKAQMGPADMRLPILFAMSYPERLASQFPRFNFMDYPELQFREPDRRIFRNLDLAREAMDRGGNMPCVLNAANEVAVEAFLQGKVIFSEISRINETILQGVSFIKKPGYSDFLESHEEALAMAKALLQR
jgi:1-deoxy-D-xylulose-5-phosphate reductoisomerase